ncbi:MAG: 4Fe-4S binding protein, partial [Candidatus Rokubacteria bacterium]|nr:4Fe-4S binding protein [Candidatus Rokubacteria bacterium]
MTPAKPEGIDPKYLKVFYLPPEGSLSRRDLLFGPLTPRYDIVPAVEAEACTAWKGCAQCLTACPQQAIAMDGSAAAIDKAKCIGCGACLPACPVGAIRQPLLDPERLDADLRALLLGGETAPQPRILLLVADGGPPLEGSRSIGSLCLPSIGAVSTWLLLGAFTLGADAIAILPCRAGCRHRCDLARWEQRLSFTREVLARLGIEGDRLLVVRRTEAGRGVRLKAFAETLAARGPHRLRGSSAPKSNGRTPLADLLQHLGALGPAPPAPLCGEGVPFGMVRVQAARCTLCGACPDRCPTGALVLYEDADSSQLLFDHARCLACEACIRICPEGAVEVERRLECSRLGSWAVLAEDEIVRCQRCGTSVAPKRMLRKIQSRLGRAA